MRFIESFEESTKKRLFVPDPVVYISSEKQEELIRRGRYNPTATTPTETQPEIVVFDKAIYFSDDGSRIAYYQRTTLGKRLRFYSINYTNNTKTFIKEIDITSLEFSGKNTEKCFISNDGKYAVLSVPSERSVYFYDIVSGSLLQTITDDQPNFGSKIAIDSDFKGMLISTGDLQREPLSTDTRSIANSISSIICTYKRNYTSSSTQKFIKIHSRSAYAPITDNSSSTLPYAFIYLLPFDLESIENNVYIYQGVHRTSDISCKNNIFALSCLGLKNDQLNYKSRFWNYDSSRYEPFKSSLPSSDNNYYLKFSKDYSPGSGFLIGIRNDSYYNNVTYKMFNNISCKMLRVINNNDNKEKIDGSIYSSTPIPSNMFIVDLLLTIPYQDNFNKKHNIYSHFSTNFYELTGKNISVCEQLLDIRNEEITFSKTSLNDTSNYYITEVKTNNIKNIRINRYPLYGFDNLDVFNYIDYVYNGSSYEISPNDPSIGLIKIIFKSSDRNNLENCFISNEEANSLVGNPTNFIHYDKPFLNNPSLCPDSEFDYESDIVDQTIHSSFVSNNYLFLNFNTNTIIFKIENDTCKSLKFVSQVETLKDYNFVYNNNGEFFSKLDKIYKFDTQTNLLIKRVTL